VDVELVLGVSQDLNSNRDTRKTVCSYERLLAATSNINSAGDASEYSLAAKPTFIRQPVNIAATDGGDNPCRLWAAG
jgi:hypothetical protein